MNRLEELRNALVVDPTKAKTKFCVKLCRALKLVLENPDDAAIIGLRWCPDNVHFFCNARIFADFLGIKLNTINSNFRVHGFSIDTSSPYDPGMILPDPKSWKVRWNPRETWNSNTTEQEAERIPSIEAPSLSLVLSTETGPIPDHLLKYLSDNEPLKGAIVELMNLITATDKWKNDFLTRAFGYWLDMAEDTAPIPAVNLIRSIKELADPQLPDDAMRLVEVNLVYLLAVQNNMSQVGEGVSFVDFLRLALRFGLPPRIAHSIYEVSEKKKADEDISSDLDWLLCAFSQSQREVEPCFAVWFVPSADQGAAASIWSRNQSRWIVRMSKTPNLFTVQLRHGKSIIATHIKFDALATGGDARYFVEFEKGEVISRGSLLTLLCEVLELDLPVSHSMPLDKEMPQYVDATICEKKQTE